MHFLDVNHDSATHFCIRSSKNIRNIRNISYLCRNSTAAGSSGIPIQALWHTYSTFTALPRQEAAAPPPTFATCSTSRESPYSPPTFPYRPPRRCSSCDKPLPRTVPTSSSPLQWVRSMPNSFAAYPAFWSTPPFTWHASSPSGAWGATPSATTDRTGQRNSRLTRR